MNSNGGQSKILPNIWIMIMIMIVSWKMFFDNDDHKTWDLKCIRDSSASVPQAEGELGARHLKQR